MEFHKYGKIKVLGDKENEGIFDDPNDLILIEEKIDGANFRVYIQPDGRMFVGSRNRILDEEDYDDKSWKKCVEFISQKLKDFFPDKDTILFGECCIAHTITYDFDNMPPFLAFDVKVDEKYLDYKDKIEFFDSLNIPYVPIVGYMTAEEFTKKDITKMVPVSEYALPSAKDRLAEGITIKNYDKQIFAKYVRDKFKEKNREVFGGSPKRSEDLNEKWVYTYATNPRIEKAIMKLVNDGKDLSMSLMGDLIKFVWDDIWDEEYKEITYKFHELNFKICRNILAKRCKNVLEQMIINTEMAKKE